MNILFAASEAAPFVKTGGLGDVALALPGALAAAGHEVRVILPCYRTIKESRLFSSARKICEYQTPLGWRRQYTGVYEAASGTAGLGYFLIENDYYFSRSKGYALYGDYDDGERFAFFSRAVAEGLGRLGFPPDILHCNDWQTALIPFYLRLLRPVPTPASVFTIHNAEYQGRMPADFASDVLGLNREEAHILEYEGGLNLMKGGILSSDAVTTVSGSYAEELCGEGNPFGLREELRACRLTGIVNGIDCGLYDPRRDESLPAPFSPELPEGKAYCKAALRERMGLTADDSLPLAAIVSRLTESKGWSLLDGIEEEMMNLGLQLVVLGQGEARYEDFFRRLAERYPGRAAVCIGFDETLARQIYAGADLFLMPSRSEPCGLAQLIAMRYGCLPVVRETGGLRDTVPPYRDDTGEGRGFTFFDYTPAELLGALKRAVAFYRDGARFPALQRRNMAGEYGWAAAAEAYLRLYERLLPA